MSKVLICGGRDYRPTHADAYAVRAALAFAGADVVIHGGARGVDAWAGRVAERLGLAVEVYPADWRKHGKAAGPIRNRQMLDVCDEVIALPGGRGTRDCVAEAHRRGIPVTIIKNEAPPVPAGEAKRASAEDDHTESRTDLPTRPSSEKQQDT